MFEMPLVRAVIGSQRGLLCTWARWVTCVCIRLIKRAIQKPIILVPILLCCVKSKDITPFLPSFWCFPSLLTRALQQMLSRILIKQTAFLTIFIHFFLSLQARNTLEGLSEGNYSSLPRPPSYLCSSHSPEHCMLWSFSSCRKPKPQRQPHRIYVATWVLIYADCQSIPSISSCTDLQKGLRSRQSPSTGPLEC